jgi:hypothetical protein
MDNKINEIRRKISSLRAEMLALEVTIRGQIARDEDCSASSLHLMGMRGQLAALLGERNALGGHERLLDVEERLKADYRAAKPKPVKGAIRRRG